ncbi:MAG: aldehyde dehydrogenase family protein [Planctomycetota bacterium]|nr:aldehyde dehydrogenase family protein [Planctomycetota bacterium]
MTTTMPATANSDLDTAINALKEKKDAFAALDLNARIQLLDEIIAGVIAIEEDWVRAACKAKGLDINKSGAGEEWLAGPMAMHRNLRLLKQSLIDVRDHGTPQLPANSVRVHSNGQTIVKVFPADFYDKLLFKGFVAEVWQQPEVTPENLPQNMAVIYQGELPPGKVCLVLGAGNVSSIGPLDVIYKMFVDNELCILKMNPVNEYLGPLWEKAFKTYIDKGFLRVVYGAAQVGDYLCKHDDVDSIHITGSDKTHDIIVWGPPGDEREERKKNNNPVNSKPITSELGNVSPVVIVPGQWSAADIQFHATNVASMLANNGSFNCNAAKLLILHEDWAQRTEFMDALQAVLKSLPPRKAYYPGAGDRYKSFTEEYSETAVKLGAEAEGVLPWTLLRHADSKNTKNMCFTTEAFCGVLAETTLPGADAAEFLDNAVEFCNNTVWGTLNACIIVDPKTEQSDKVHKSLEKAKELLRYGTIGINHWPALGYCLASTPWGAFPGHTLEDIQSGIGVVHNTYLFNKSEKTVIKGPFRLSILDPVPPWFVTNSRTHITARKLTKFEAAPSLFKLPGIAVSAALG